jgi:hypothetical protein
MYTLQSNCWTERIQTLSMWLHSAERFQNSSVMVHSAQRVYTSGGVMYVSTYTCYSGIHRIGGSVHGSHDWQNSSGIGRSKPPIIASNSALFYTHIFKPAFRLSCHSCQFVIMTSDIIVITLHKKCVYILQMFHRKSVTSAYVCLV